MKTVFAILVAMAIMSVFYGVLILSYYLSTSRALRRFIFSKWHIVILAVICLVGALGCIYALQKNQYVYYWDYGGYWSKSYDQSNLLFNNPISALNNLYLTITSYDYNLLLPTIISLPIKIFGNSYVRYVLINYFMFFVPVWLLLTTISLKIKERFAKLTDKDFLIASIMSVALPVLLLPLLRGFIDIGAVMFVCTSLLVVIDYNPLKEGWKQRLMSCLIGVNIAIAFLCRRYFAFYSIGIVVALVITSIIRICKLSGLNKVKVGSKNAVVNYMLMAVSSVGLLLLLFPGLVFKSAGSNYGQMYSAYQADFKTSTRNIMNRFGFISIVLAIVGALSSIRSRNNRRMIFICIVSLVITLTTFLLVQTMDMHHTYTIVVPVFILMSIGIFYILTNFKYGKYAVIIVMMLFIVQLAVFFSGRSDRLPRVLQSTFGDGFVPLRRYDISVLHKIVDYVNKANDKSEPVYVLASSSVLNDDIMMSIDKPNNTSLKGLLVSGNIDLRDGFPMQFLDAKYVIDASPAQTHMARKDTQRVITYLHDQIETDGSYINKHYEMMPERFTLDNNVVVSIYKKVTDYSKDDKEKLSDYYHGQYPNNDAIFRDRIMKK